MAEQLTSETYANGDAITPRAQKIGEVYGSMTALGGDLRIGQLEAVWKNASGMSFLPEGHTGAVSGSRGWPQGRFRTGPRCVIDCRSSAVAHERDT